MVADVFTDAFDSLHALLQRASLGSIDDALYVSPNPAPPGCITDGPYSAEIRSRTPAASEPQSSPRPGVAKSNPSPKPDGPVTRSAALGEAMRSGRLDPTPFSAEAQAAVQRVVARKRT